MRKLLPFLTLFFASAIALAQSCPANTSPQIVSNNTTTFVENQPGLFSLVTSGSPLPVITETGALPSGVTFVNSVLTGTPVIGSAAASPYILTFTASNCEASVTQTFSLVVSPAPPPPPGNWQPPLVSEWQWLLSVTPTASQITSNSATVWDFDGFDGTASLVNTVHSVGKHAICYIDAGTAENFRPDYSQFPAAALGKSNGWPGEKWLDIRNAAIRPIMAARFAMCKAKGFDAVEPDNIDGYTNSTGFPLKASDQLVYNEWIATTVHGLGLSVALKNDGDQVGSLLSFFDFDINEQCVQYNECSNLTPFVNAGKAVFEAEYQGNVTSVCATLNKDNFNGILDLNDGANLSKLDTECR